MITSLSLSSTSSPGVCVCVRVCVLVCTVHYYWYTTLAYMLCGVYIMCVCIYYFLWWWSHAYMCCRYTEYVNSNIRRCVCVCVCVFLVHVCGMVLALNSLRSCWCVCVCVCVCVAQSYLSWLSLYLVPSPHCLLSLWTFSPLALLISFLACFHSEPFPHLAKQAYLCSRLNCSVTNVRSNVHVQTLLKRFEGNFAHQSFFLW